VEYIRFLGRRKRSVRAEGAPGSFYGDILPGRGFDWHEVSGHVEYPHRADAILGRPDRLSWSRALEIDGRVASAH